MIEVSKQANADTKRSVRKKKPFTFSWGGARPGSGRPPLLNDKQREMLVRETENRLAAAPFWGMHNDVVAAVAEWASKEFGVIVKPRHVVKCRWEYRAQNKIQHVRRKPDKQKILALQKAVALAGGQKPLARRIGTSQSVVHSWLTRSIKGIPPEMAIKVERATGVPCRELRPDLWT